MSFFAATMMVLPSAIATFYFWLTTATFFLLLLSPVAALLPRTSGPYMRVIRSTTCPRMAASTPTRGIDADPGPLRPADCVVIRKDVRDDANVVLVSGDSVKLDPIRRDLPPTDINRIATLDEGESGRHNTDDRAPQ